MLRIRESFPRINFLLTLFCVFNGRLLFAQFSPPAGFPGSAAIYKDSSIFVGWATGCETNIEWQNISDTALGKANAGTAASAIGIAGENGTVSLGDGGTATFTFAAPIFNGTGADFAIFENAFIDSFLEFAFVEVSSDGINYVRFPAICNIQDTAQTASFGLSDCSLVYNLAGTFRANFGTPFDLEELKDSSAVDIDNINFIRIVDVVGSINPLYATYDVNGNMINDPWPTDFPSSGFDLDAVGAIHQKPTGVEAVSESRFSVFPNPAKDFIGLSQTYDEVSIYSVTGILQQIDFTDSFLINVSALKSGLYFIKAKNGKDFYFSGFIKTD